MHKGYNTHNPLYSLLSIRTRSGFAFVCFESPRLSVMCYIIRVTKSRTKTSISDAVAIDGHRLQPYQGAADGIDTTRLHHIDPAKTSQLPTRHPADSFSYRGFMTKGYTQSRLSSEEQNFYAEHGYLLAKSVFSRDEAAHFHNEAHQIARRLQAASIEGVSNQGWAAGAKITDLPRQLLHSHNVQYHSAAFSRLICDPRLTDRAADIIGPNIQLHHTKMFIKPPAKGAPFPMHQDFPYFPHQHHTMIAAIIHFDDAPIEKGCVRVVPGSHKLGPLEHLHDGGHHLPIDEYPITEATPCPAEAGDVLFFSYLTIHGSGLNESSEARTTLLLQLRDPADLPTVVTHVSRGQGMILHGIDPLANSGPSPDSALRLKVAPCT